MACSGSHPAFGGWLGDARKMGLGNERTLLTGIKGRYVCTLLYRPPVSLCLWACSCICPCICISHSLLHV